MEQLQYNELEILETVLNEINKKNIYFVCLFSYSTLLLICKCQSNCQLPHKIFMYKYYIQYLQAEQNSKIPFQNKDSFILFVRILAEENETRRTMIMKRVRSLKHKSYGEFLMNHQIFLRVENSNKIPANQVITSRQSNKKKTIQATRLIGM